MCAAAWPDLVRGHCGPAGVERPYRHVPWLPDRCMALFGRENRYDAPRRCKRRRRQAEGRSAEARTFTTSDEAVVDRDGCEV